MENEMSIHECILDALADDGESIIQIEGYFKHTTYIINRNVLKQELIKLLNEDLIRIVYPPNKTVIDFEESNKQSIEDFWFEQTEKGNQMWSRIDF